MAEKRNARMSVVVRWLFYLKVTLRACVGIVDSKKMPRYDGSMSLERLHIITADWNFARFSGLRRL